MARGPVFSVVVPTRDRPGVLERALLQIKAQTYKNFEVIVVDDSSTCETIARYRDVWTLLDQRFTLVLRSSADRRGSGPSAARTHGMNLAEGEFITFCDDDDYWCDDQHLEIVAEAFARIDDADILIANQQGIDSAGRVTVPDWLPQVAPCLIAREKVSRGDVFLIYRADLLKPGGQIGHLNASILRRSVIERTGGFWDGAVLEEDRDFLLRALDGAERLLFRSNVVAVHTVPDYAARANASTRIDSLDRWLVRGVVAQHVILNAESAEVLGYARMLAGDAFRHVATHFAEERRFGDAWRFAASALAFRRSFKWALYTLYLVARSVAGGAVIEDHRSTIPPAGGR